MARRKLVLAAGLMLLAAQLVAYADYFTDDSYIYARFATNLVERGEFVFNPGERIHAATSPVWALLVAALVAAGIPVFAGTKLLGGACALGAALLAWRIGSRRYGSSVWCAILLLLFATEPWFVRWSASGMETPLAVFLLMLALEAGLRPVESVDWTRVGWSLGLMPLVRPEASMLVGFVGLLALVTPDARRRWGLWIGLVAPIVAWSAFAWPYYGAILPATLQAKSTPLGFVPSRLLGNVVTLGALFVVALALPSVGWAFSILRAPRRLLRRDGSDWLRPAVLAWTVALPVVYLVRDVQVVSRYLEIVLPAVLVLGVGELARWTPSRIWSSFAMVEVVAMLGLTLVWIVPSANGFGRSLAGVEEMGEWLGENTGPEQVVAAYDIGALGWASDRRILDLGGLVHPEINDLRNEVADDVILRDALFLEYGDPSFLVDRDPEGSVLDGQVLKGVRCEKVMVRRVENLGLTRPAPVVYTLYRLVPAGP
jgi:hypothetical protein